MKNLEEIMTAKIAEYRASGKTLTDYCAENDLSTEKMKYWLYARNNQKRSSTASVSTKKAKKDTKNFVSYDFSGTDKKDTGLVLEIRGIAITIEKGFDKDLLRDVTDALLTSC